MARSKADPMTFDDWPIPLRYAPPPPAPETCIECTRPVHLNGRCKRHADAEWYRQGAKPIKRRRTVTV